MIGPGHQPEYTNNVKAKISGPIYFDVDVQDITIAGLYWDNFYTRTVFGANNNNIKIQNNYIVVCTAINIHDGSNWLIEGNVFYPLNGGCGSGNYINLEPAAQNVVIKNNFFQSLNENNDRTSFVEDGSNTTQFINNTCLYLQLGSPFFNSEDMIIEDNIFWTTRINNSNQEFTNSQCTNCTYNNNLFFNPNEAYADNFGNNNIYDLGPQFESVEASSPGWNYEYNYQLKPSSPASNAGTDGTDLGMFGANFNFNMFGFTSIPRFISIETNRQAVKQGDEITFSIEAISPGN